MALGELAACSLGSSGTGDAEDASADSADANAVETSCTGPTCNGVCLAATDCRTCSGAPLLCGGRCVASCQGCADSNDAAMPIGCFACDTSHQNPIGTCQYSDAGAYCLSGNYLGHYQGGAGYQCECSGVASCPGATQVCLPLGNVDASFCLTCGEPTIGPIQGSPCKGGGACRELQATCQ